jgi:hypothetical protein
MTARGDGHPLTLLARHFFRALFDFGVFTQEGADAFVRFVIGLVSLIVTSGLLLVYMYAKKYAALFGAATAQPYADALLADTTLAIALPMWMVAVVTVLVSHSLFPDEIDYRVLMPLPVDRRLIFGSKLLALALFAGLFTATTHLAIAPLVLLISAGRWAVDPVPLAVLGFFAVSIPASLCALLAVVAIIGAVISCIPRQQVHGASAAIRSLMLGTLVLALPMVLALPARAAALGRHSRSMFLAPPAWFMGAGRVLLGHDDPYFVDLARIAAGAFVLAALVAAGSYVVLYRRFDRVMLHSFGTPRARRRWRVDSRPARAAIRDFTTATLQRSALHQGVVIALSTCGVALTVNGALRSGLAAWLGGVDLVGPDVLGAVARVPFPLIVVLGLAARASLALPIEPRANWVFQITERDAIRADELAGAERVLVLFAAAIPVAAATPLQWLVAGPRALLAAAMTLTIGLFWVEILLRDWHRIPFTCSYLPGKHTVAQSTLAAVGIFVVGGAIASGLELMSLRAASSAPALVIVSIGLAIVAALRARRRRRWKQVPLVFDDPLPSDVLGFRLH